MSRPFVVWYGVMAVSALGAGAGAGRGRDRAGRRGYSKTMGYVSEGRVALNLCDTRASRYGS